MKKIITTVLASVWLCLPPAVAQNQLDTNILDTYIQLGLAQNLSLRQQQFTLQKSLYALSEAKSLFLPNTSLQANYYRAAGGRTVDFPVGDLLNPVYATLNQMTGSDRFVQLQNQRILLNPNDFYDARLHTTLPLINAEIVYNRRIKQEQVSLQQIEVDLYKRELVKDIKSAYFHYLQAMQAVKIYESALRLVQENQRINHSLRANDQVNRTAVIRSENEVTRYQAQVNLARQNQNSAQAYFNFLLNRDRNAPIVADPYFELPRLSLSQDTTVNGREELRKLNTAAQINHQVTGLSQAYLIPRLSTFLDLGSQGSNWQLNEQSRYYFFGLALQWDVFAAGRNRYKIKQARMDQKITQTQTDYVASQLRLQLTTSVNGFQASLAQYRAAVSEQASSQKYYNDMLKLYKEGQALFIEVLDAQNQLITAQVQQNISLFDTWIKATEIERANAGYNLNNN